MYGLLKNILFKINPEQAHTITLKTLKCLHQLKLTSLLFTTLPKRPLRLMGLQFPNPIGLAAGLDKNGDYIDALSSLGFGFIEIGTITPRPQTGNQAPRLFRLIEDKALINRLGFNNQGIDYVLERLEKINYTGILGINIGKNADTPMTRAYDDYLQCFHAFWRHASYITINVSSPNTKDLRQLQTNEYLPTLLHVMKNAQRDISLQYHKYVPIVLKIAPDLSPAEIIFIADMIIRLGIDGVIATNTTVARNHNLLKSPYRHEVGGLSGTPLNQPATSVIKTLATELKGNIPIIASGGIMNAKIAAEKMAAGANLIQLYTGLVYHGPRLLRQIAKYM
jgi:dihydroorotate dehydrogenase